MNRETIDVIKEVAMKAKECFAQSDGDMFRACIGGVWSSGAPLCNRGRTNIGRNFIQECLLLIAACAIGTDRENESVSDLLNKASVNKCSRHDSPTFPKVYLSEVRDYFEKSIGCCHNGYCDDATIGGGAPYKRVAHIFDELSTVSDEDWNTAIDWLFSQSE